MMTEDITQTIRHRKTVMDWLLSLVMIRQVMSVLMLIQVQRHRCQHRHYLKITVQNQCIPFLQQLMQRRHISGQTKQTAVFLTPVRPDGAAQVLQERSMSEALIIGSKKILIKML